MVGRVSGPEPLIWRADCKVKHGCLPVWGMGVQCQLCNRLSVISFWLRVFENTFMILR